MGLISQILIAIGFMTRLPVPYRSGSLASAAWAFPLAGALVGALSGGALWFVVWLGLPTLFAVLIGLAAGAMVTGALHEDGWADCCDGFWGGATPERRLEIMRDSRSGVFGVLGLIFLIGMKAVLLASLIEKIGVAQVFLMLIALHGLARGILPLAMTALPRAGSSGMAVRAGSPGWIRAVLALALAIGICALTLFDPAITGVLCLATGLAGLVLGLLAWVKLKGINGDTLGGMEQLAELFCLIGLSIWI